MSTLQIQVALVVVLLLVNAAFAGSEIALISLRRGQLERLRRRGVAGRVLAELAEDPNQFLATIQIGITLAGFLASATAATAFADELAPSLAFLGGAARPVAIVGVTLVLTFLTLVVGELAPKRIAMSRAEGWALLAARPLRWLARGSRPAVWLLSRSTDALVRVAGVDPNAERDEVTNEELREMLLSRSELRAQRHIFAATFDVGERVLRQIVVPRPSVTVIPPDAHVDDAIGQLRATGHSRAPLGVDLDHVVGVVHLQDLAGADGPVESIRRPALHLPETLGVLDALREMQRRRQSLAVVVDEYGGGVGIVTTEDVLEEIVGEIYDEFDRDQQAVHVQEDGTIVVDGAFPVHDLHDLGLDAPATAATTVAGIVLEELGRIPTGGESVTAADLELTVVEVDGNAIRRIAVRPRAR